MQKSILEQYALGATLRSADTVYNFIDQMYGPGAAKKNPALVSTLLRFQESMIQSTTELIVAGKLSLKELEQFNTSE